MGKEAGSQAVGHEGAPRVSARIPLFAAGGWYKGPRFSRLREDQMIFTSSLAAFADLWGTCPPQLSRSTWGSGTGLGGWLRSHDGPHSAQGLAQRQPDPRHLQQGWQAREEEGGHQAPMLGLGGATQGGSSEAEQASRSCSISGRGAAAILPTDLPSPTGQIICPVSFLPALSAGALMENTSLQAVFPLPGEITHLNPWQDDSSPCGAYPASQWEFPMGKGAFRDTGGC